MKLLNLPGAVQSCVQQRLVNKMNCKLSLCVTSHERRKKNFKKGRITSNKYFASVDSYFWTKSIGRGE